MEPAESAARVRPVSGIRGGVAVFACLVAAAVASTSAAAAGPLRTSVLDTTAFTYQPDLAFQRTRAAGATSVRLLLSWREVAPSTKPVGFNAADPAAYGSNWASMDYLVSRAVSNGLDPLITIMWAPDWAEAPGPFYAEGTVKPDPAEFALFASAAATRYSGSYPDGFGGVLPRVRYWQAWNEPNLRQFLMPQTAGRKIVSTAHYRKMVNAFYRAVHAVHANNLVVAGGTAPFGHVGQPAPLAFMRSLLCLSPTNRRVCRQKTFLDAWATHPYTNGGPNHHAFNANDVSIGDLPEVQRVLRAAKRAGLIVSSVRPQLWVTEFSWDTKPVDPRGVPVGLHGRWVSEALYRMWKANVYQVTWWLLRDRPFPADVHQSGLFYCGTSSLADESVCMSAGLAADKAKPVLTAFRFPFVALRENRRLRFWGRTPNGLPGQVGIERKVSTGWAQVMVLNTNAYGIFGRSQRGGPLRGTYRATYFGDGTYSLPFSLGRTRDIALSHPFGCGGPKPC